MARASVSVRLDAPCDRACAPCDCRDSPSPCDALGVPSPVRAGGERLVLRGEPSRAPSFAKTLAAAREAQWSEVWVRAHGASLVDPAAAAALRAEGVRGVIVPVFSHVSGAHDAIAGRPGALVTTLRAMRALADAGLSLGVEVPLLEGRLQDLEAIVTLCHRATPALTRARFFVPRRPMPPSLAPPRWSLARPRLAAALRRCDALGVAVSLEAGDGIPPCALGHDPELASRVPVSPSPLARRPDGFALGAACHGCALVDRCPGPTLAYHAAHHDADLAPFAKRPKSARAWSPGQREAAQRVSNWVLRPTINCNQDCPFCSANETSANVLPTGLLLRRIARAARKGVKYLSFSGGEPTLSKDLVHYIRAASRLGIKDIELVTNGVLLDGPEKVRPLVDAGLNRAFVSLHGHDELVARRTTSKIGDHARTVRALDALVASGVDTEINHVISSLNYPYLPRFADFVAARWRRRVGVSLAFVTPQFRALERGGLVPRISDVMPHLRRAMRVMVERGVSFTVGSRQGIPPCFLGEYTPWSDVFHVAARAHAEDAPQKTHGPRCSECRYARHCVGLWKPYADRYGFDELTPVPGPPLSDAELDVILHTPFPPRAFELAPAPLRMPLRDDPELPEVAPARLPVKLPVLAPSTDGVVRVVMVGSGPQALRLSRAMANVPALRLVGLSSPHLDDRDTAAFGDTDRDADLDRLLERARPDALIIAAATTAHHALSETALARGLPALVEKPFTRTLEQAEALAAHPAAHTLMVAHAMRFSPGVVTLRDVMALGEGPVTRATYALRARPDAPSTPATWAREALLETLYHAVYTLASLTGGGAVTDVRAEARKTLRPEWIRARFTVASGAEAEITLDYAATAEGVEVSARDRSAMVATWRREGADESIVRETASGQRDHSVPRGSDAEAMLAAFRDAVLARAPSPVSAREGADTLAAVHAILDALGPQLTRAKGPKHVASPSMRG